MIYLKQFLYKLRISKTKRILLVDIYNCQAASYSYVLLSCFWNAKQRGRIFMQFA